MLRTLFGDPIRVFGAALTVFVALACTRAQPGPRAVLDVTGRQPVSAWDKPLGATFSSGACRVQLAGAGVPPVGKPGAALEATLWWLVGGECAGTEPQVFVHVDAPGAELRQAQADHAPLDGKVSPVEWGPGDVLVDRFSIAVPATIGVDTLDVYVGWYEGKKRWPASTGGDDRVKVATIHVDGAPPLWPEARARHAGAITIDGVLDEPTWKDAQVLGPFVAYDGKSRLERATTARLAWDEQALYVAFEADDPDPFTPYTKRDDPLYDSEALEIFIDADGDKDVYVELQSAPTDVHFDAAFAGGRRKNMDLRYDVDFVTKTRVDGARLVQEWRIPIAALSDVPPGEPRVGAAWRINLFRLERVRDADKRKIVRHEASAWSTPLSGDFHNLDRFALVRFE